MAYTDDAVTARLNSLNETQDSIVANAQWIMFHRRHADRTASLWLAKLQDSAGPKRLNLVYLVNEVVQQSRARGKQDFMVAFEPIIAEATSLAYKGVGSDVQGKIRRVVDVWRQRSIFDKRILDAVDARLNELDKQRGGRAGGGTKLGGSLFGGSGGSLGSIPVEIEVISKSQTALNKAEPLKGPAIEAADVEYAKMTDPSTPIPTPPVHASRLSGLLKKLASAQGAVEASITARKELLSGLEKLLESNRGELAKDEAKFGELVSRREETEMKKKDVEDAIMRGLSNPTSPGAEYANGDGASGREPSKPEVEGFTPPPPDVEEFTPPSEGSKQDQTGALLGENGDSSFASTTGAESTSEQPLTMEEPAPTFQPPSAPSSDANPAAAAAKDFLNNFNFSTVRQASTEHPTNGAADPRLKRRKMTHDIDDDIFGADGAATGVDEESISAMLNH